MFTVNEIFKIMEVLKIEFQNISCLRLITVQIPLSPPYNTFQNISCLRLINE